MEVNAVLDLIRSRLTGEAAPLKIGANQNDGVLTVRFAFPDVARTRYAAMLADLASATGWTLQVWPNANQQALLQAATHALPADLSPLGTPAIQQMNREVIVRVRGTTTTATLEATTTAFTKQTGYQLVVQGATVVPA